MLVSFPLFFLIISDLNTLAIWEVQEKQLRNLSLKQRLFMVISMTIQKLVTLTILQRFASYAPNMVNSCNILKAISMEMVVGSAQERSEWVFAM
jgi:hypothetical protein